MKRLNTLIWSGSCLLWIAAAAPALASNGDPGVVPEPATWLLLGSGLAGLAAYKWYRSR